MQINIQKDGLEAVEAVLNGGADYEVLKLLRRDTATLIVSVRLRNEQAKLQEHGASGLMPAKSWTETIEGEEEG